MIVGGYISALGLILRAVIKMAVLVGMNVLMIGRITAYHQLVAVMKLLGSGCVLMIVMVVLVF